VLAHAAERKRAPGETKLGPTPPRRLDGVPGLKRTVTIAASHVVEPHPEGSRLTLAVDVHGPLSRIGWLMTRSLTEQYVETEASCVKRAAEDPAG
jgi:hypothetical protein